MKTDFRHQRLGCQFATRQLCRLTLPGRPRGFVELALVEERPGGHQVSPYTTDGSLDLRYWRLPSEVELLSYGAQPRP